MDERTVELCGEDVLIDYLGLVRPRPGEFAVPVAADYPPILSRLLDGLLRQRLHPPEATGLVAVLDTGFLPDHPLLNELQAESVSFVPGEGPADENGHGTVVALLAVVARGGVVRPRLLNVKVLDREGRGTEDALVAGIRWAVGRRADVINLSAGIPRRKWPFRNCRGDCRVCEAAAAAAAAGVMVAVAAGNDGTTHCPATVGVVRPESGVYAVAALNPDTGELAEYSAPGNTAFPVDRFYFLRWPPDRADFAVAYLEVAALFLAEGQVGEARAEYLKAAAVFESGLPPSNRPGEFEQTHLYVGLYQAGRMAFIDGDYEAALDLFHQAERLVQTADEKLPWLDALIIEGDGWRTARTSGQAAEYISSTIWELIGRTYDRLGNRDQAITHLRCAADSVRWLSGEQDRVSGIDSLVARLDASRREQ